MSKKIYSVLFVSICISLYADESAKTSMDKQDLSPKVSTKKNKKIVSKPQQQSTSKEKKEKIKQKTYKSVAKNNTQKAQPKKINNREREQWLSFLKSISTSVFTGTLIGAMSGQGLAYTLHCQCNYESTPKRWAAKILAWFLWSAARQTILDMFEEEMNTYHIKHNKMLIDTTGICMHWISCFNPMFLTTS